MDYNIEFKDLLPNVRINPKLSKSIISINLKINGKLDDNCNCYNAIINFKKNNTGWAVCQLPECMQSSEEITPLLTNEQHEHYKTCKSCNTGLISDNVYNSNIDIEVNCDLYGLPPSNNNNIKKNPLVIILLLLFISLILIIVYVKLIK